MEEQLILCMGILAFLISFVLFFICKWTFECCSSIRERIRISREDTQSLPTIELELPTYAEDAIIAGALATRRNLRDDNMTSDNVNNDTQLNRVACIDSYSGNNGNETENKETRHTGNESGVTLNLGEVSDANSSRNDKQDDKPNVPDDSGVKSGSGEDTVDKYSDEISSKYDSASGSSAGGGDFRAPSGSDIEIYV